MRWSGCFGWKRQTASLPLPVRRERAGERVLLRPKFLVYRNRTLTLTLSRDTGRGDKSHQASLDCELRHQALVSLRVKQDDHLVPFVSHHRAFAELLVDDSRVQRER